MSTEELEATATVGYYNADKGKVVSTFIDRNGEIENVIPELTRKMQDKETLTAWIDKGYNEDGYATVSSTETFNGTPFDYSIASVENAYIIHPNSDKILVFEHFSSVAFVKNVSGDRSKREYFGSIEASEKFMNEFINS